MALPSSATSRLVSSPREVGSLALGFKERLAAEDLLRLESKTATATTFREFVQAFSARDEFPSPRITGVVAGGRQRFRPNRSGEED